MRRGMCVWQYGLALAALVSAGLPAGAQHMAGGVIPMGTTAAGISQPDVKRVTLDARDLPLARVIDDIAAQSGTKISYADALVRVGPRVTVRINNSTPADALALAVRGTSFRVTTFDGQLTIVPAGKNGEATQGVIMGKVLDAKTKRPIVGATVTVDGASKGVATGSDGAFTITVSAESHVIHVRAIGYTKQAKTVVAGEGKTLGIEFLLETSVSALDEVIVTGTVVATERKAIPTPITVITAEDIEKRGITRIEELMRGEIPGVLAIDPGVSRYEGGSTTLGAMVSTTVYSRGASSTTGSPTPLKTYIDGVELLDPSYLGTIDPKSIERIEIITGPQAATIYGSGAMGGVMQIFTKKGVGSTRTDFTLSLRYGALENSYNNGRTPAHNHGLTVTGGTGPELSYSGTLSYGYQGQWQPGLFSQTTGASIGLSHTRGPATITGSVSTTYGRNGTAYCIRGCSVYFNSIGAQTGELKVNPFYPGANNPTQRIGSSNAQTISMDVDYRAASWWQHHATVGKSQTDFAMAPSSPAFFDPTDTLFKGSASTGQRTTYSYNTTLSPVAPGVLTSTLTLGANGSFGNQTGISGCLLTVTASSWTPCSSSSPVNVTRPLYSESWGGFGTWRLGVFDRLYLTLAVRGERNPAYGAQHKIDWTPTNGVAYSMEVGELTVKLQGSYGRATRPPSPDKKLQAMTTGNYSPSIWVSQLANPELKPEYSRGPQGGIELYYGNIGSFTINHYAQTVTDLIESVTVDSVPLSTVDGTYSFYWPQRQSLNTASVKQFGWDVTGSVNVGVLTLKGTYSWADSRVLSVYPIFTGAARAGDSFKGIPTHMGSLTASYAMGATNVTVTANYIGAAARYATFITNTFVSAATYARIKTYIPNASMGTNGPIQTEPGYVKTNLAASHRLTSWASATLNVTNLGNQYNSDTSQLEPTLGRQTQFGLSMRFPH